jgi:D-cysteine desulfhydrase family pyridoxal phosphate-dependent enzyme
MSISLPRKQLVSVRPTPIEPLLRLSELLNGPRIFIKRDDLTGLAGGGNKARKLELFAADALRHNADTLVTEGAAQSNHCRQTAAAAAMCGLRCILVLRGEPQPEATGNVLLDRLLGAELYWAGDREREDVMADIVEKERGAGRTPYAIPLGGSTPLGAAGFAYAMEELAAQGAPQFDRIVFASSSGGTHAGLAAGARLVEYGGQVLGICIDERKEDLCRIVAEIATETMRLLGQPGTFAPRDICADDRYLGEGYGILGAPEREAISLFARVEGILLDPVYTGRAAAGLLDLIRSGEIRRGETVLFWHTGGVPALWAYGRELEAVSS